MLINFSTLDIPELSAVLARMGHGDGIILADAHFLGESFNDRVLRADGLLIPELLASILPLFEFDAYVPHPLAMMAAVPGDRLDPKVEESYLKSIHISNPNASVFEKIDRLNLRKNQVGICSCNDKRNRKIQ